MNDRELRDEAMTRFLVGDETMALTLSWTWYLLAMHPPVRGHFSAREPDAAKCQRTRSIPIVMRIMPAVYVSETRSPSQTHAEKLTKTKRSEEMALA